MLGLCAAPDVLLAYQPIGPKVDRFIDLIQSYPGTRFSCLIDDYNAAKQINRQAAVKKIIVKVFIDLNVGMDRSGILPVKAFDLYQQCIALPHIQIIGLHLYDGHIHDKSIDTRVARCNDAFAPVENLVMQLRATGFYPVIVAGGTPTFPVHATRADVECSPGTFIYWDAGYEEVLVEQSFLNAALVITRIVSLPQPDKICVDLGHKSIASENEPNKRVFFLNAPELTFAAHSEEHLVLNAGAGHSYKVGDLLYGVPYHICPTVALYERAVIINNKQINGEWKNIARDRKINF
jgi:D-serine deaminase-like pyridoxal phosphate-dependent protein